MGYDTLILSGGAIKGVALLGSFKYLLDHKLIKSNELKHIIGASVGALFALPFLLNINIDIFYHIIKKANIDIINKDNFNIQNLFNNFGFTENNIVEKYVNVLIKNILKKSSLTLKELYELSNIKFTVKVSNITKNKVEYINHENYPNLDLSLLIKMTTCVPLVFKPVKFNNCLYCDGAIGGGLPIEYNTSENYLGINLNNTTLDRKFKEENKDIFDYTLNVMYIFYKSNDFYFYKKLKNIIVIDLKIKDLKFHANNDEKEKLFIEGYKQTKNFFN